MLDDVERRLRTLRTSTRFTFIAGYCDFCSDRIEGARVRVASKA